MTRVKIFLAAFLRASLLLLPGLLFALFIRNDAGSVFLKVLAVLAFEFVFLLIFAVIATVIEAMKKARRERRELDEDSAGEDLADDD